MSVTAMPLDPGAQARALLHHLLETGDIVGRDTAGRAVIQLAADDWLLERLLTFDAGTEDHEDGGDAEDDDPAVVSFIGCPPDGSTAASVMDVIAARRRPGCLRSGGLQKLWRSISGLPTPDGRPRRQTPRHRADNRGVKRLRDGNSAPPSAAAPAPVHVIRAWTTAAYRAIDCSMIG